MPGLCKEPRSNCIREEFLGNLHLLSLEEREPLWIYFAGDSTGRQLWAAFLKDVANINLGNTKDAVRKLVDECPKAPVPDKAFQRFVNAHTRRAGLKYPKWEGVGGHACDWNATLHGQDRPVRVTFDFRRFLHDPSNDLHVLQEVADAGRWPTAWLVISGVHDCMFLRRNLTYHTSSVKAFFRFLEQHSILKSRTILVGMEYMVDQRETPKGRSKRFRSYSSSPKSLYNCSLRLHRMMLQEARQNGVYVIPRWELTRNYAEKEVYDMHYPESVILSELPPLLTGLSCIAKDRQHVFTSSLITTPSLGGSLLLLYFLTTVAAAVGALVFVHRGRIWRVRTGPDLGAAELQDED